MEDDTFAVAAKSRRGPPDGAGGDEVQVRTSRKCSISRRRLPALAFALAILIFAAGCGGGPKNVKSVTFNFRADAKSNGERPVHIMIREVSKKAFLTETYAEVADIVYAEPRDKSLLAVRVILPGEKDKVTLEIMKPDEVNIGVYGMFTEPGKGWRLILETPIEKKYSIQIRNNNLECENISVSAE